MRYPEGHAAALDAGGGGGGGHLDEGTIHAWLDDALPPDDVERLVLHLEGCAGCRAAVAEARGLVAASRRILRALDDGPGGVGVHPLPEAWPPAGVAGRGVSVAGGTGSHGGRAVGAGGDVGLEGVPWGRPSTPARRRWRVPAVAAVAVLAVGTAVVVQRVGSPPASGERVTAMESPLPPRGAAADELREPASGVAPAPVAPQATIGADASTPASRALVARGGGAGGEAASGAGGVAGPEVVAAPETELRKAPPIVRPPLEVAGAAVASATEVAPVQQPEPAPSPAAAFTSPIAVARGIPQGAPPAHMAEATVVRSVGPVVAGRVLSTEGEPVDDVQVTIPDARRGATTDAAGRFRFAGLPPGEHGMLVRKIGFQPARLTLRVSVAGDSAVSVTLAPIGPGGEGPAGAELRRELPAPVPVAVPPVLPGSLSVVMRRLSGCYRLELGGATSAGRDVAESALPGWIHLRSTPSERAGWLAADPLLSSSGQQPGGHARWRAGGTAEVEVVWPTAAAANEVVLRLRGTGEVLTGTAALRPAGEATGARGEEEVASVVFVRSVCSQ